MELYSFVEGLRSDHICLVSSLSRATSLFFLLLSLSRSSRSLFLLRLLAPGQGCPFSSDPLVPGRLAQRVSIDDLPQLKGKSKFRFKESTQCKKEPNQERRTKKE